MYSMVPVLPELEAGLFFDAFDRSNGNLLLRMRYSDATGFRAVLELLVATRLRNLVPAVLS
jgi:hypothetical protein